MSLTNRAVFFDRDGVLIEAIVRDGKPFPPDSWLTTRILPGVQETLKTLKEEGFYLIVITNQPDVARGMQTKEAVENINKGLRSQLPLDHIYVCYHDDADKCDCRKPKQGMLVDASLEFGIDLASSFFVGDRASDIECGQRAGCQTVFIDRGYREENPLSPANLTVTSLENALAWILGR